MRILVTGATGQLGTELMRALAERAELIGLDLPELDVTRDDCVEQIAGRAPSVVVHAGALTNVDGCERDPARAMAVNAEGTRRVADACRKAGARLLYLSTDFVFDGAKRTPYTEDDRPAPLSVYGRSKLEGERATVSVPGWTIVRTAWLYAAHGTNFVRTILAKALAGEHLRVVDDQVGSPTYAADLADAIRLLIAGQHTGLYHLTNSGACSWFAFTQEILRQAGLTTPLAPITTAALNRPAARPAYSALAHRAWEAVGFRPLRPWPEALAAMLKQRASGA